MNPCSLKEGSSLIINIILIKIFEKNINKYFKVFYLINNNFNFLFYFNRINFKSVNYNFVYFLLYIIVKNY